MLLEYFNKNHPESNDFDEMHNVDFDVLVLVMGLQSLVDDKEYNWLKNFPKLYNWFQKAKMDSRVH